MTVQPSITPAERTSLRALVVQALVDVARRSSQPDALAWLAGDPAPRTEWWRQLAAPARVFADEDASILELARRLHLGPLEELAIALLAAVEDDAAIARAVTLLQEPLTGSRPSVGLVAVAFAPLAASERDAIGELATGRAVAAGVVLFQDDGAPLAERRLVLAPPVYHALRGSDGSVANVTLARAQIAFPPSIEAEAARHATVLRGASRALAVRSGSQAESRAACALIASALGGRPAFVEGPLGPGAGAWLALRGLVPVFVCDVAPGEKRRLVTPAGYDGPVLVAAGNDGTIELDGAVVPSYRVPVPARPERALLWRVHVADAELADRLSSEHRHGAGRIAELAANARRIAELEGKRRLEDAHVRESAWSSDSSGLSALAEPVRDRVGDAAFVRPPLLARDLELFVARCLEREDLGAGLGAAIAARARAGVRALFVGPSGTGKTFAASWLATRLGTPLYRVDLAATTSKYIGETEKNLAQLLDRAEQQDVILLFDEADAMFGKRTDIKDSNDRFANAQTNYLLQRIETFDGIVILTSNSRNRLDAAFTRRLDFVIDFPLPGPEERRDLWLAHLGPGHRLDAAAINQLAATVDLVGGHIRNAVLAAAVLARGARRPIELDDLVEGLLIEYRKVGRSAPPELQGRRRR